MLMNKFLRSFTYSAMIASSLTFLSSSHAIEDEGNAQKNNCTALSKFYPSGEVGILLSLGEWLSQGLEPKHQYKLATDEKAESKQFEFSLNNGNLGHNIWCGYEWRGYEYGFPPSLFEIQVKPGWGKNQNRYWEETTTTPGPKMPTDMIMAALIRPPLTLNLEYSYCPHKPRTFHYDNPATG